MEHLNRIELKGIVGSAKCMALKGQYVHHFTVATNYRYKTKDGEIVIETTWHNVVLFTETQIEVKKGDKVHVAGRLRSQRYINSNGEEYTTYEVIAKNFEVINTDSTLEAEMEI